MGEGMARGGQGSSETEKEMLKARQERCVCKRCGGKLTTGLVIYDIYGGAGLELYCPKCEKTEFGVEKAVYDLAEYYVENFQFNYFYDMEENDLNTQLNISKVADMITWILKNIDLLDDHGLKTGLPDFEKFKRRRARG